MRERWAADAALRAQSYWSQERTRGLFGDKRLAFPPAEYGPLLRAMALLRADASMSPESVRKYLQISHMYTLVEPLIRDLVATHPVVRILDLGCGNSYLTLMMATAFQTRIGHAAQILGVDRNPRLIDACQERAWRLGLDAMLKFEAQQIDQLSLADAWRRSFASELHDIHMVVALHACDTATDDAIALGLALGSPVIAVAPCCQAELAKAWSQMKETPDALQPIRNWPHMRRDMAATLTDALRSLLLRGCGYDASPMEFVPSEHTPKNTLIRAVRRHEPGSFHNYLALKRMIGGVSLKLETILPAHHLETIAQQS